MAWTTSIRLLKFEAGCPTNGLVKTRHRDGKNVPTAIASSVATIDFVAITTMIPPSNPDHCVHSGRRIAFPALSDASEDRTCHGTRLSGSPVADHRGGAARVMKGEMTIVAIATPSMMPTRRNG